MEEAKLQQRCDDEKKEEEQVVLPGFRFHPTDEELVGFYLRRKVDQKPLRIELIKQIDIYKYDPWDLPKVSCCMGEKEWYFFCRRGRKYRNSIRPNRVTGSGFWKATGIDKPIYSSSSSSSSSYLNNNNNNYNDKEQQPHHDEEDDGCIIIGLKKSLVYYRGSAGKGTKTDWMMHEFRLPPPSNNNSKTKHYNPQANDVQEAEVWTLCRIFKRIPTYKKYTPNLKDSATTPSSKSKPSHSLLSSKTCSFESDNSKPYLTFTDSSSEAIQPNERKFVTIGHVDPRNHLFLGQLANNNVPPHQAPTTLSYPSFWNQNNNVHVDGIFANENWDDLTSVVQFAMDPSKDYCDYKESNKF